MVYLVSVWHSSYLLFGLQYACCKDMSVVRNVSLSLWPEIRSGLLLGRPLLFFICMSFRSGISFLYFHVHFQILGLLLLVNIAVLLLRVSCFPSSSYDHQSLFVAPFLRYSATVRRKVVYLYQSRRIST